MSDCWVAFSPRICSGDMCMGEPIREPAMVRSTEPSEIAMPKSSTFTRPAERP